MANYDPSWLGLAALLLLLAASLATRIEHVRTGLTLAAVLALPVTIFRFNDVSATILLLLILVVNLVQGMRHWLGDSQVRFSAEEQELRDRHFAQLSTSAARRLIQGHWITGRRGEVLIREDQAAPSLFYLADGTALVQREGVDVGTLTSGVLIGEATVLDGVHATGTVSLSSSARLWFVPAAALRSYLAANPEIAATLHEGFARALRGKLAAANTRIADRPSLI
jgi:CRP/FNR family transcriptional regulator, cyclic AMP receptor protein